MVYPRPDAEAGELPIGAAVLAQGATATIDELLQFVAARVGPSARCAGSSWCPQSKSASGKILRRVLVAEAV